MKNPELTQQEHTELLDVLKNRFNKHPNRHPDVSFDIVETRLNEYSDKLRSLFEMEKTGGEPDVVGIDQNSGEVIFFDCSIETPKDRRNVCYDREALEKRKQYKPENTAMDMADAMGIELLSQEQYRFLQTLGDFDTKTSSWLKTPDEIRKLGGAIFGDKRYGQVFIYHNGADSYYGVRGFRGCLRV
ncbi:MAG: DUF4256 domain-containing protein [Firmicutes bacterium HGW-Firmicutes-20]|jgi:hypothetical protein|nr:MAG: DUF4256 domain-containing protein [Firmicutes bacterium HGW-Firmicutes-20]